MRPLLQPLGIGALAHLGRSIRRPRHPLKMCRYVAGRWASIKQEHARYSGGMKCADYRRNGVDIIDAGIQVAQSKGRDMAENNSSDGMGWLVAIALGGYLAYLTWWKEPEVATPAPLNEAARFANLPDGPLTTLSNGTEWRMIWGKLKGPREARLAWVREDHTKNKERDARETLSLFKINCTTTGYVTLSVIDYDKDGKMLRSFDDFSVKEAYPVPGSQIETVTDAACLPQFDSLGEAPKSATDKDDLPPN